MLFQSRDIGLRRMVYVMIKELSPLEIRQNDRLAVNKLVSSLTRGSVRSPLAQCVLIRYSSQVIRESANNTQTGEPPFL
ncbi:coatomer subunit gamma-2-like isoform X2 [Durio zibethinus]|uniref:Coatomer subunit gamma-2-like isoform X2 n=1 Tax=Durio zibethinus TaxID=66656 RepID=A0A6P5WP17_DURZI|nr:coatomer subunit gamma-2-like isoform X2 [Durio zibethinus]